MVFPSIGDISKLMKNLKDMSRRPFIPCGEIMIRRASRKCHSFDRMDHACLVSVNQELLSTGYAKLVKNTGEMMAHGDDS